MTKSPCCLLYSKMYGCKSHNVPKFSGWEKSRFIIQMRFKKIDGYTEWINHEERGYSTFPGNREDEARHALKNLRRRRQRLYVTEYRLVRHVSTFTVEG